jgi:arginyl-tRNA synthetase
MIREKISKLIQKAIKELKKEGIFPEFKVPEIEIEYPKEKAHGDYSTNITMVIAKLIKKEPMEIAKILGSRLQILDPRLFDKIEVAPPGFINFFLSNEYLQKQVKEILKQGEKFGNLEIGKNKKLQVEFISANPTGPLTVGNSRGGPFGDTLGNVLKKAGFKIEKAYYINDYGMQILALGHSVLKDSEAKYRGDYIDHLNKIIKEKDVYKAGEKAAKIIIKEMVKETTDRMGIKYDEWISETKLHRLNFVKKIFEILKKKNLLYQKEEASWFKSSNFSDERDRVLVKKDGWKTYLAGDIALHYYKFEKKKFDKVINIWGADHAGDVPGLQAGVSAIGHKGKLDIILLQFVTLFEKKEKLKMSKRLGIYVTMDELLNKVGIDVARFFFLQKSADTHLNFDLDLAKEQSEKNPVYYVQYAHARICSILRKSKVESRKLKVDILHSTLNFQLLNHPSELELIKQLIKFSEVIEDTARDYQVQRIPQYALDLAAVFHRFYRDCRVLTDYNPPTTLPPSAGPSNGFLKKARLGLILATKTILKNTLDLMGISAPERM